VQRFRATLVAVFLVAVVAALVWVLVLSLSSEPDDTAGLDAHVSCRVECPLGTLPRFLG
jgi:hypothetical protein